MRPGICYLAALIVLGSVAVMAQHEHDASEARPDDGPAVGVAHDLSPALREALVAEMHEIDRGMQQLVAALARGEWEEVAETAARVETTFILRQRLSAEQKAELHAELPAGFLDLDRRFHGSAGKLAQAARRHDSELAAFHLYRLYDACVSCHSTYAPDAFPGFAATGAGEHEHE